MRIAIKIENLNIVFYLLISCSLTNISTNVKSQDFSLLNIYPLFTNYFIYDKSFPDDISEIRETMFIYFFNKDTNEDEGLNATYYLNEFGQIGMKVDESKIGWQNNDTMRFYYNSMHKIDSIVSFSYKPHYFQKYAFIYNNKKQIIGYQQFAGSRRNGVLSDLTISAEYKYSTGRISKKEREKDSLSDSFAYYKEIIESYSYHGDLGNSTSMYYFKKNKNLARILVYSISKTFKKTNLDLYECDESGRINIHHDFVLKEKSLFYYNENGLLAKVKYYNPYGSLKKMIIYEYERKKK